MANENGIDRIVRLVLGLGLVAVAWLYMASLGTVLAIIIGVAGLILLGTAAIGWCPLYSIFGISTCKLRQN